MEGTVSLRHAVMYPGISLDDLQDDFAELSQLALGLRSGGDGGFHFAEDGQPLVEHTLAN